MMHEKKQRKIVQKEAQQKKLLEDALEQAKQATVARTVFLRNMSHDIRTPLNAVIGFTDLALNEEKDIDKIKEYLSKIHVSGKYLQGIINEVLEISRIDSGQTKLEEKAWNLRKIIDEVELIIREQAREKDQIFLVDVSELKDENVYCDKLRIKEILLNLLGNSVKFTQPGGEILLKVSQKKSDIEGMAKYEITIIDNGCGMNQKFIERIFEPFEREYSSTDSGVKGAGLGMPIVKHFVDMMKGTIKISSEEKKGTKIVVELKFCLVKNLENVKGGKEEEKEQYDFQGKRLLLAEDNEMNREIVQEILTESGFIIDSVENGQEAVRKIKLSNPGFYDAILMDIQMPVMDGYEATKQIRDMKDSKISQIPIIAISANAFEEDKSISLSLGMNAHLGKPLDVKKLMAVLKQIL